MRVNVELARTTEETGHVEPGPTRRSKFPSAPRRLHHLRLHHRPLCHRRLHQLRLYHRRLHRCHQASPALAVSYSPHMRPDTHTHSSALTSIRPAPDSGQDRQICACVRALACVHARKRSIGMRGGGGSWEDSQNRHHQRNEWV